MNGKEWFKQNKYEKVDNKKTKTTETYISIEPCCREFLLWVLLY